MVLLNTKLPTASNPSLYALTGKDAAFGGRRLSIRSQQSDGLNSMTRTTITVRTDDRNGVHIPNERIVQAMIGSVRFTNFVVSPENKQDKKPRAT